MAAKKIDELAKCAEARSLAEAQVEELTAELNAVYELVGELETRAPVRAVVDAVVGKLALPSVPGWIAVGIAASVGVVTSIVVKGIC